MPDVEGAKPAEGEFKTDPIGCFHGDIVEGQAAEGQVQLHVEIHRSRKFAFVQVPHKTGRTSASAFLESLIAVVPDEIHAVLIDNGIPLLRKRSPPASRRQEHAPRSAVAVLV